MTGGIINKGEEVFSSALQFFILFCDQKQYTRCRIRPRLNLCNNCFVSVFFTSTIILLQLPLPLITLCLNKPIFVADPELDAITFSLQACYKCCLAPRWDSFGRLVRTIHMQHPWRRQLPNETISDKQGLNSSRRRQLWPVPKSFSIHLPLHSFITSGGHWSQLGLTILFHKNVFGHQLVTISQQSLYQVPRHFIEHRDIGLLVMQKAAPLI